MTLPKRPSDDDPELEQLLARAAQQLAAEEGDRVRQQYQDAPEVSYSPEFLRGMEEIRRSRRRRGGLLAWNRTARRAAMITVVVISLLAATLSVKGVRSQLYSYFVTHHQEYSELRVTAASDSDSGDTEGFGAAAAAAPDTYSGGSYHYVPTYVPAGYVLRTTDDGDDFFYTLEYVDEKAYADYEQRRSALIARWGSEDAIPEGERITYDGPMLLYTETRTVEGTTLFDTENAIYKELTINGSPAYLSMKNGHALLLWDNGDRSFNLVGQVSEAEILRMAESLSVVSSNSEN